MTAVFFAHGSPMVAVERDAFSDALRRFGESIPKPQAVLVMSAHWEATGPVRVTSTPRPPLIYDFSGFPEELYGVRYPCPGHPDVAAEAVGLLAASGRDTVADSYRGLDHGVWVPLLHAFPAADIPVVQVSMPRPRAPADVISMGKALAPLRERGVLLVGSGGLVHNLRQVRFEDKQALVDAWAKDFDQWAWERIQRRELDALSAYRAGPQASLAVPTSEHYEPHLFVLGAARPEDRVTSIFEGFHHGNLSMRSFRV